MVSELLRIKTPNFAACLFLSKQGIVEDDIDQEVDYMIGWPQERVEEYCAKKGWKVEHEGYVAW